MRHCNHEVFYLKRLLNTFALCPGIDDEQQTECVFVNDTNTKLFLRFSLKVRLFVILQCYFFSLQFEVKPLTVQYNCSVAPRCFSLSGSFPFRPELIWQYFSDSMQKLREANFDSKE